MIKLLSAVAAASALAMAAAPASAQVFQEFTVNENAVPGSAGFGTPFVADKINGAFTEFVTFTGPNTFQAQAYATFGLFLKDEGTVQVGGVLLNAGETVTLPPIPPVFPGGTFPYGGYQMYAVFTAGGTFSGAEYTGTSASFNLYIDAKSNTTLAGTTGLAPITVGNNGDDILVATSTSLKFNGEGDLTANPGAYAFTFDDFTLTAFGKTYFTAPNPFHIEVNVSGDNDVVTGLGGLPPTTRITGDVSAVFRVPEPGSLAIVAVGLLAAGLAGRRRQAK